MRSLSGLTVVVVLAVCLLAFAGELRPAEHALRPLLHRLAARLESTANTTSSIKIDQTLESLYQSASLSFIASGYRLDQTQMLADMRGDNPNVPLNRQLAHGGVLVRFPLGRGLLLCAEAKDIEFRCLAAPFRSGVEQRASGRTLAKAESAALVAAKL